MGLRVLILAGRKTGYESVKKLITDNNHRVVGVVSREYEGQVDDGIKPADFQNLLDKHNIPFWETDQIHEADFIALLKDLDIDVGLSIGWRRLVREPVVLLPKLGFYNFHASDLPKYRGFASTSWAIINGETKTAMTVHKMIGGIADHGDIYLKQYFEISQTTTVTSLLEDMATALPGMVNDLLDGLEKETLKGSIPDESVALYSYPRHPVDGWIDWNRSAVEIDRLVRALSEPYPGAYSCLDMKKIIILSGAVEPEKQKNFIGVPGHIIGSVDGSSVDVLTGEGIYTVHEIRLESGDKVVPAEIIKGVQQRFGISPGDLFEFIKKLKG